MGALLSEVHYTYLTGKAASSTHAKAIHEVFTGGFMRSRLGVRIEDKIGIFDYHRPPNAREVKAFRDRLARLQGAFGNDIEVAEKRLADRLPTGKALDAHGYRVRETFSYLGRAAPGDYSDRRVVVRKHRPPATRLVSSQGATLRFYLTALAVAQMSGSAGTKLPTLPIAGATIELGWPHLVATGAVNAGGRNNYLTAIDKRARSIKESLSTLEGAGMVDLRATESRARIFEDFILLNEAGKDALGGSVEYRVPRQNEATILLPSEFIRQSWIHVLADSELAVLLMIACGQGALPDQEEGMIAIPSGKRVSRYGIGRDPYSRARKTLELFGLVSVQEVGRHFDGKAEDDEAPQLHRFKILPDGFKEHAPTMVISQLADQLKSSGRTATIVART
ncbi:hypothetical protein IWX75_003298 [Arthrobacter sp. CAN_A6]|uniref:hypothetical protein n=1 Tax=Arthrobacter sp. CAN_A6 TaxID=2787721 RepID=UPI0018CA7D9F